MYSVGAGTESRSRMQSSMLEVLASTGHEALLRMRMHPPLSARARTPDRMRTTAVGRHRYHRTAVFQNR